MRKEFHVTRGNFVLRVSLWLSLTLGLCFGSERERIAEPPPKKMLKIIVEKEGEISRFFVKNLEETEITVTFEMDLINLEGSTNFPYTTTYPGKQTTEAFTLAPIHPDQKWDYSYTSYYTMGSCQAVHDDGYVYSLPYAPGSSYKVTQGHNGSYSHTGAEQYAIDWRMPVGTAVHAARSGIVAKVKDDSSKGGGDRKYEHCANYILIRHDDGTLANYAHLQKAGSLVVVGQTVEAGDLIGFSGSTGFSTGPHLHFAVFKTRDGRRRESIPVRFRTSSSTAASLVEGRNYKSFAGTASGDKTLVATHTKDKEPNDPPNIGSPSPGQPPP
jgi:murein DD-endopeptidase MepM/ murein hydrolase activator NlpD